MLTVRRTHLALPRPAEPGEAPPPPPGVRLEQAAPCPPAFWRYLYREVGRRYHWVDRLGWSDAEVRTWLDRPGHEVWSAVEGGAPAGFFELDRKADGAIEVSYFGLMPERIGRGLGRWLLEAAIARAWALGAPEVRLNTCTLDDPAALPNYAKRGFRVTGEEDYQTPQRPDLCEGACCT